MLQLLKSTEVNIPIPEEQFYEKESYKIKQDFVDHIEGILWRNKVSPTTLNISSKIYRELQIFEVRVRNMDDCLNQIIRLIDSKIPYPVLFIITQQTKDVKAIISYKKILDEKINIEELFETDKLSLQLKGNTVDAIYANYLYQIVSFDYGGSLEENFGIYKYIKNIQNQIDKINQQIRKELSVAKKQALARKRKDLENVKEAMIKHKKIGVDQ
jgi:hypothetical protein